MTDHQPPAFPRVSDSPADEKTVVSGEIFSRPGEGPKPTPTDSPPAETPTSRLTSGDNRARWAVVGVATLVVVALIGAFLVFAGPKGGTPSTVARYAPADTVAYFEARLDLPGDQHNGLAAFMSHFPGFADQSAFDQKFDELLSQLLDSLELSANTDWEREVKPWFGGQVGVFSSTVSPEPGTPPSLTFAFSVRDKAFLDQWMTNAGEVVTHEGQEIHTGQMMPNGLNMAATDDALVVGMRIEDVKAALDARADRQPGLADDQFFLQQLGALRADYLGLMFYDGRGTAAQLRDQLDDLGGGELSFEVPSGLVDLVIGATEARTLGELRADTDHLTVTARRERPADADLPPLPANRSSTLAGLVPAQSVAYVEMRDVGQTISFALGKLMTPIPGASPLPFDLSGFDQMLGTSVPEYFDFLVDVGASFSVTDGDALFGLVASVDDEAIAQSRVDRLLTLARSLMQFGGGITFEDRDFDGVEATVIKFGDGPASSVGGIAVAINAGTLFIGNEEFVEFALDHPADAALAERPEYQQGLQAGGANNSGVAFVDLEALRGLAEATMSDSERAEYELNQQPFLEPLSHLIMVNSTEGTTSVGHVFLYVE